jgi:uncharacterized membrane protein YkvA (DUF1232 family)
MNKRKYNYSGSDTSHSNLLDKYSGSEISEPDARILASRVEKKITRYKFDISLIKHIRALIRYLLDKNVKWYRKSIVVAALIYFLTPIDAIPDFTPFFGFLDDIGVIAFTIRFLGKEMQRYY